MLFSLQVVSNSFATPWTAGCQAFAHWVSDTISSSDAPFSSCPQSFPALGFFFFFPMSQFFASGGQSIGSFASVPPVNIQGLFPLGLTSFDLLAVQGTSQVSSPAPQFESIISSALSLLYGPTFTSVHDYWKNHSFDCMDLCRQSGCLCFLICCLGLP